MTPHSAPDRPPDVRPPPDLPPDVRPTPVGWTAPPPPPQGRGLAIAALSLGIGANLLSSPFTLLVALAAGTTATVLGIVAALRSRRPERAGLAMAVVGAALGGFALLRAAGWAFQQIVRAVALG